MLSRIMRSFFIALSKADWAQRAITHWGFAWKMASRFIAGEQIDHAIQAVRELNRHGINATLDHLGENTTRPEDAQQAVEEIIQALHTIDRENVRANVSVKLSQLGLVLDEQQCRDRLGQILQEAGRLGIFVRIDMEDSSLTERTLNSYLWALSEGYDHTGIVIQAYLYRSESDITRILEKNGRVRLCKGAYHEPASLAFPLKKDVDASYDRLATRLLEGSQRAGSPQASPDGRFPPILALASHDEGRIRHGEAEVERLRLPKTAIEFQMLYGIRRDLQETLAARQYPVRVYVPYGTHWYPYFMRRLAERPANLWFFLSNLFRK